MPAPRHVRRGEGQLSLPLAVQAPERLLAIIEDFLGPCSAQEPRLVLQLRPGGHPEGYTLNVTDLVRIEAPTEHGLFNGLMTSGSSRSRAKETRV